MSSDRRDDEGADDRGIESKEKNIDDDDSEQPCSTCSLKRKRVESETLPIHAAEDSTDLPRWVAGASPAKFVTLDELMNVSEVMENMALVHEIAVNPEFSIPETSSNPMEKTVKECFHQLYWEKLKEDLAKEPPDYQHAFSTLLDVKTMILDLLTPQHIRLRMEIESRLDEVILRQQLDKNCIDWVRLSEYIIDLLARLCAPVRDEKIAELRRKTELTEILRGICELLELMKVDMANFEVKLSRPIIEEHSAEYERKQFFKLLESDRSLEISVTDWLQRHINAVEQASTSSDAAEPAVKRRFEDLNNTEVGTIISSAYLELLEWDESRAYPSTMLMDRNRISNLSEKYLQLIVCTSCVLVTCVAVGQDTTDTSLFKQELKKELIVITNDIDNKNSNERLEAMYVHCDAKMKKLSERDSNFVWTETRSNDLRHQIMSLANVKNPVRCLMRCRIRAFILSILKCEVRTAQQKLPAGVSMVREELNALTAAFVHLVLHNRKVFGTYYGDLIKKIMSA